jgi:Glutaredoxin-like domain (DUF836)
MKGGTSARGTSARGALAGGASARGASARGAPAASPEPGVPEPPPPRLTLYGRAWCHLCEEMLAAVKPIADEFGASVDVVDIDADPALLARYDEIVPVLALDGVELARYRPGGFDGHDAARVRAALSS